MRQSLGKLGKRVLSARRAGGGASPGGTAGSGSGGTAPGDAKAPAVRRPPFLRLAAFAERVERTPALDGPAHRLSDGVARVVPPGTWLDDVLHGVHFGQPAHPALVRLPLGCWTSAVLLDYLPLPVPQRLPGTAAASQALLAAGLAASVPSAATGLADWSALHRHQQRVGLVHAVAQGSATALFGASLLARLGGQRRAGKALSLAGLTAATAGAYLGGHLALRLGAGASHAESIEHLAPLGWQDLCRLAELPVGRPARRQLGYLSLLALRVPAPSSERPSMQASGAQATGPGTPGGESPGQETAGEGERVFVLSDHCAHLGGPLHQGRVVTERGATCIACPWHGSVFRVEDGSVVHGPATARQPSFESRVTDSGWVQVRPRASARET